MSNAAGSSAAPLVAVRCRPLQAGVSLVETEADGRLVVGVLPFRFDHVFDDQASQERVYQTLGAPLIAHCLDGLNTTLFAYGQTGSGKSHSMSGNATAPGIIPRLVSDLFTRVASLRDAGDTAVSVSCSIMEINNEVLMDLLAEPTPASNLNLREDPVHGVLVLGLRSIPVGSEEEVHKLLDKGNALRAVAATQMNSASSRSHLVVSLRVLQRALLSDVMQREVRSTINLVDLAGSERASKSGTSGNALRQGACINKSLSALGNVINALAEANRLAHKKPRCASAAVADKGESAARPLTVHVPYRDSKLTRVLQESLGGNSVTVMLANISQSAADREETLATLHFAERARAITLKAKRNEITTATSAAAAAAAAVAAAAAAAMKAEAKAKRESVPSNILADAARREQRQLQRRSKDCLTRSAATRSAQELASEISEISEERAKDRAARLPLQPVSGSRRQPPGKGAPCGAPRPLRKASSASLGRCRCRGTAGCDCECCPAAPVGGMQHMVRRDFWAAAEMMFDADSDDLDEADLNRMAHALQEDTMALEASEKASAVVTASSPAEAAVVADTEAGDHGPLRGSEVGAAEDERLSAFLSAWWSTPSLRDATMEMVTLKAGLTLSCKEAAHAAEAE